MRVTLRPLGKNSWSGVVKYRNCYEDLGPYFTRSGRIYTGLTKADEVRLEDLLGYDLNPSSDFWHNFFVRTGAKDLFLDTSDPMDELRYLFLKSHKRVAASIFERKSSANFVLIDKDEEAKKSNIYNRTKRRAFREFDKLSSEEMIKALRLYGHKADNMSPNVSENMLYDLVEGNPQKFIDLWVDNSNREVQYIIENAIAKNILRKVKNIYRYGTDTIGHSLEDTIAYLKDPQNQDLKIAIMKGIEGKTTIKDVPAELEELKNEPKNEEQRIELEAAVKEQPKKKTTKKETKEVENDSD